MVGYRLFLHFHQLRCFFNLRNSSKCGYVLNPKFNNIQHRGYKKFGHAFEKETKYSQFLVAITSITILLCMLDFEGIMKKHFPDTTGAETKTESVKDSNMVK